MALTPGDEWDDLIARYRRLVITEPSQEALDAAVALMRDAARGEVVVDTRPQAALAELDRQDQLDEQLRTQLSEDILEFQREKWEKDNVGRRRKREYLQLQDLAFRAAGALWTPVFLCTHDFPIPERYISLSIDVGLVVFHQAYFDLWERLPPTFQRERIAIYHAFLDFAEILPATPDALRVKSLVFELNGETQMAAWYLREAVRTTPSDHHEFLTVLQSAWAHLMELGQYRRALLLLHENARRVNEQDYEEFRELVGMTVDTERSRATG